MRTENYGAIILAAGSGIRMKSAYPPVMLKVLAKPMIAWVLDAVHKSGVKDVAVVVSDKENMVASYAKATCEIFEQTETLGTLHAAWQTRPFIEVHQGGHILILNGNAPLMNADTICEAYNTHLREENDMTVVTVKAENPFGYSRIVRDADSGSLLCSVEERDAPPEIKKIDEVNAGAYWIKAEALLSVLSKIADRPVNANHLSGAIEWLVQHGYRVGTSFAATPDVARSADTRIELHALTHIAKRKIAERILESGVDIPCFGNVLLSPDAQIGMDTTILPGTILRGNVTIGRNCIIGPNTVIEDSIIGDNVILNSVQCEHATVKDGANIGPFVHIRPNSVIGEGVHLGNFVEVKNSNIDSETKVSHLTYVGDSDVGKHVNFGCGTVTVNYTGKEKFRTTIKDDAFIGCNTNLVAPVTVGEGAYTAAGSTITEDVPDAALGIARARQENKIGWVLKKR